MGTDRATELLKTLENRGEAGAIEEARAVLGDVERELESIRAYVAAEKP